MLGSNFDSGPIGALPIVAATPTVLARPTLSFTAAAGDAIMVWVTFGYSTADVPDVTVDLLLNGSVFGTSEAKGAIGNNEIPVLMRGIATAGVNTITVRITATIAITATSLATRLLAVHATSSTT